jgi:hypothetical protein
VETRELGEDYFGLLEPGAEGLFDRRDHASGVSIPSVHEATWQTHRGPGHQAVTIALASRTT